MYFFKELQNLWPFFDCRTHKDSMRALAESRHRIHEESRNASQGGGARAGVPAGLSHSRRPGRVEGSPRETHPQSKPRSH